MSLGWALAQNRTITGTVTSSEDGEPVISATVVVEGNTSIGVTTDMEGHFSLSVPANAKRLVFSYVGLKTQTLDIKNVMNVVLEPDTEVLGTVVVLGYGTGQKLSTVSGSVAHVSSEKIAERPVANVMDALQGQVAGMQVNTGSGDPNAVADIQIHGTGSLGASSAPLYIVDGMQTDLSVVSSMNPNDFESITVLKDASSTSIFGARAANGVIVITTKRGKSDEKGGNIVLNAQYGVAKLSTRAPVEGQMTTEELLTYQARHKYARISKAGDVLALQKKLLETNADGSYKYGIYDDTFTKSFDWLGYYLGHDAPTYQVDLSMSGGSNRTQYYLSFGHYSQEGISVDHSLYRKYSGRINLDSRVKDWFKVGMNLSGSYGQREMSSFASTNYINTGVLGAMFMAPYLSPLDNEGNYRRTLFASPSYDKYYAQEFADEYNMSYANEYQANLSAYLQLTPIDGLTIKSQWGLDLNHYRSTGMQLPGWVLSSEGLGSRSESFYATYLATITNTAEYKFNVEEDHNFTILLGQEWVENNYNAFAASASGLEHERFMTLSNGRVEDYLSLPSQSISSYAYLSFFGRLNYGWKDQLFVDLSLRNDQSSRFGRNKRSAVFYSVGLMYDLHRAFLEDSEWLNALRLRGSWGTTGNSSIPLYAYLPLLGSTRYVNSLGLGVTSYGNEDLSWETQGNLNIGVSAEMFDSSLRAEVDYYYRQTSDMLMAVPQGYSTGFGTRYENVGSMFNTGVDLTIQYDILRTKDWNVYASTTFNYNLERITKIFHGLDNYVMPGTGIYWEVGKPQKFFAAEYVGLNDQGKQLWLLPDGTTSDQWDPDLMERGLKYNINPPISGGFSFGASWKGLALDFDWAYMVGKWTINNDQYFAQNNSSGFLAYNRSKKLLNEWQQKGDELTTDIPKYEEQPQFDSRFLEDASFLRLKNVKLSYTLPSEWLGNNGVISGIKVYVLGRNLLTVTKFSGFDPEATMNVTRNQYPNTMQFAGGLQLFF